MTNDEVAMAEEGRGISKERLFDRAPDTKISQEHGRAGLGTGLLTCTLEYRVIPINKSGEGSPSNMVMAVL